MDVHFTAPLFLPPTTSCMFLSFTEAKLGDPAVKGIYLATFINRFKHKTSK